VKVAVFKLKLFAAGIPLDVDLRRKLCPIYDLQGLWLSKRT